MKKVLSLILAATFVMFSAPAAAAPITFKVTMSEDLKSDVVKRVTEITDKVTAATKGEIKFQIFPSNQLGSINEYIEQVRAGAPIIGVMGFDNMGDIVPEFLPASMPYLFNDPAEVFKLAESKWMEDKVKLMGQKNLVPLAFGTSGYRHFIGRKPIRSAADIKGQIVRMGPSKVAQNFITVLGGSPTTSKWADNYSSIQQGVFDACEASLNLLYSSSLFEVAKHLSLSGHFITPMSYVMSTNQWDRLSPEYKKIMKKEWQEGMKRLYDDVKASEDVYIQKFKDAKIEVIEPDKKSFAAAVPELLKKLGYDSKIYNEIRAAIEGK